MEFLKIEEDNRDLVVVFAPSWACRGCEGHGELGDRWDYQAGDLDDNRCHACKWTGVIPEGFPIIQALKGSGVYYRVEVREYTEEENEA